MSFDHEKRTAMRLLSSLENGSLSVSDIRPLVEEADPALVYLVFGWLRARYHPGHPSSDGVLGRIVGVLGEARSVAAHVKKGEGDAIVVWFEESYDYKELDRDEFIDLVVDKLEG